MKIELLNDRPNYKRFKNVYWSSWFLFYFFYIYIIFQQIVLEKVEFHSITFFYFILLLSESSLVIKYITKEKVIEYYIPF